MVHRARLVEDDEQVGRDPIRAVGLLAAVGVGRRGDAAAVDVHAAAAAAAGAQVAAAAAAAAPAGEVSAAFTVPDARGAEQSEDRRARYERSRDLHTALPDAKCNV